MIGESLFTGLLGLFWLAEAAFASLVVYWFVTEGFAEREHEATSGPRPLEPWAYTRQSLLLWCGFFGVIVLLIVVGA